jgi:hypothetical protein
MAVLEPLREVKNYFDYVRDGFANVAQLAEHVHIHEDRLEDYALALPECPPENTLDADHHYYGDEEGTAAYILTLDSINFGSGYEPHLVAEGWKLIDHSLYYSISTRLKQYFDKNGPIEAGKLKTIGTQECMELLELHPEGAYSAAFAGLCARSLNDLGETVCTSFEHSYHKLVRSARGSANEMMSILTRMNHFNDIHRYKGFDVPFYKRAQITIADLQLAYASFGVDLFHDIDQLTMFPDNGVPHVLRIDGILEYEPELATRIDKGEEVPSGSEEEVEIRAMAGLAVEKISHIKGMNAMGVDHVLWHRSVENNIYRQKSPHRTLSLFY